MISLSYKFSWQFIKYDIYKVVTCYHGSCVNDLSPATSEVPGIGHGQSTSANGDGLYVAKITAKPTVFCWFWSTFWVVLDVSIDKNPQISTKKLDSSPVLQYGCFSHFILCTVSKSLIVLQIFCCQLQHAPRLCRLHCCHRLKLLPATELDWPEGLEW